MPTILTHAVAGAALGYALAPAKWRGGMAAVAAAAAMLPDADAIGLRMGISYGSFLGHRGFTHSLLFAALAAVACFAVRRHRWRVAACLFLAVVSHSVLDAMTDGGLGVAFFSPFDEKRYFFPFHPIRVAPLSVRRFFSAWGAKVLISEAVWVWAPSGLLVGMAMKWRGRGR